MVELLEQEWYACQSVYPVLAHFFFTNEVRDYKGVISLPSLCESIFSTETLDIPWEDMPYCFKCIRDLIEMGIGDAAAN